MTKVGIILTPDVRSKAYLRKLTDNGVYLDEIIFMNDNRMEKTYLREEIEESKKCGFDISESVFEILKKEKLEFKEFNFVDINHADLNQYLKESKTDFFIFTGGGILKREILNSGPKFIHLHSGIVPNYRGSTCFYYSIINEDKCGVTAYIMNEDLDNGPIIFQRNFQKPNHLFIDEVYDSHIRSETLLDVLKNHMLEKGSLKEQNPLEGQTYFIIHPVLKHIAILSCIK